MWGLGSGQSTRAFHWVCVTLRVSKRASVTAKRGGAPQAAWNQALTAGDQAFRRHETRVVFPVLEMCARGRTVVSPATAVSSTASNTAGVATTRTKIVAVPSMGGGASGSSAIAPRNDSKIAVKRARHSFRFSWSPRRLVTSFPRGVSARSPRAHSSTRAFGVGTRTRRDGAPSSQTGARPGLRGEHVVPAHVHVHGPGCVVQSDGRGRPIAEHERA